MAGVDVPHASVGIVVTEDKRAAGTEFNAEIQLAATREMYRWMADITTCVNELSSSLTEITTRLNDIEQRLTNGGL